MTTQITNPPAGAADPFWIDYTNLRVGIGTSTPAVRLEIVSAAANNDVMRIKNSIGNSILIFTDDSANNGILVLNNSAGSGRIRFHANGASYVNTSTGFVVGATSMNAAALLQVDSTSKGFLPPRMTTAQKNAISSPPAGLVVYDSTLNKLCVYTGAAWETVTSV